MLIAGFDVINTDITIVVIHLMSSHITSGNLCQRDTNMSSHLKERTTTTTYSDDEAIVSPGIQKYIDTNDEYLKRRDKYINEVVKNSKFDTIAVHGLYTVEDAIEDYDGAIIEPVFLSSSQAYRDSDELEAALAYMIPTWCYSRIANPTTY